MAASAPCIRIDTCQHIAQRCHSHVAGYAAFLLLHSRDIDTTAATTRGRHADTTPARQHTTRRYNASDPAIALPPHPVINAADTTAAQQHEHESTARRHSSSPARLAPSCHTSRASRRPTCQHTARPQATPRRSTPPRRATPSPRPLLHATTHRRRRRAGRALAVARGDVTAGSHHVMRRLQQSRHSRINNRSNTTLQRDSGSTIQVRAPHT